MTNTLADYDFDLHDGLIAKRPLEERSASRLLRVCPQKKIIKHNIFNEICDYINSEDLLVFNNTKVIPARLFGVKATGGKIECLIERIVDEQHVLAHIKANKAPKIDSTLILEGVIEAVVIERVDRFFKLKINNKDDILQLLHKYGKVPLPPYIDRTADAEDLTRYQTIYAKNEGAVAAPTAGLHFDQMLLNALSEKGVSMAWVTLHVGAGTFQPVQVDNIHEHIMHSEWMEVSSETCEAIRRCKKRGGRVIAIGTTTVRCLETAAMNGEVMPYCGDTDIFIYPGYKFQCIDGLVTNFHLPKSTLLMLVSALLGHDLMMSAYQTAIREEYRFYSYGDAMLILGIQD